MVDQRKMKMISQEKISSDNNKQHASKVVHKLSAVLCSAMLIVGCSNQTISPNQSKNSYPVSPGTSNKNGYTVTTDPLTGLIYSRQRQQQFSVVPITPPQAKNSNRSQVLSSSTVLTNNADFKDWLSSHSYQKSEILAYQNYLQSQLGNIPPIDQLVASARDARACGFEPYEVPPVELWQNIVPTLQLLQQLQNQGYLPRTIVVRSVYRNPSLNRCAGGAGESKHMTNGAIDVWVSENEGNRWAVDSTYDGLCQFWQSQGQNYNLGLGLYSTGAIHLDTQGYRKWGANYSSGSSPCRF